MNLNQTRTCPKCGSNHLSDHKTYHTIHNGFRELQECKDCGEVFSETRGTPMQSLKSPIIRLFPLWSANKTLLISILQIILISI